MHLSTCSCALVFFLVHLLKSSLALSWETGPTNREIPNSVKSSLWSLAVTGQGRQSMAGSKYCNLDISRTITYCNPFCQDTAGTIPFGSDPCLELPTPFWRARGITCLAKPML